MKKTILPLIGFAILSTTFQSCKLSTAGIGRAPVYYEFGRNDMEVSAQKSAEATQVKILGIDWARLFNAKVGNFNQAGYAGVSDGLSAGSIPIVGSFVDPTRVQNFALYKLISEEPGYDFVLYPRFEQKSSGIPIIFTKTTAKVTAKLGKLK